MKRISIQLAFSLCLHFSESCPETGSYYANGHCYWLTHHRQSFSAGVQKCLEGHGVPIAPLVHPDWFCFAVKLVEQRQHLKMFTGYQLEDNSVVTWEGERIEYVNIYTSVVQSSNTTCFGAESGGVGLYNCSDNRNMMCSKNSSYGGSSVDISSITEDLILNKRHLSSFIRTKTSASDPRPSSTVVGAVGIIFIVLLCIGLVVVDLPNLFQGANLLRKRTSFIKTVVFEKFRQ